MSPHNVLSLATCGHCMNEDSNCLTRRKYSSLKGYNPVRRSAGNHSSPTATKYKKYEIGFAFQLITKNQKSILAKIDKRDECLFPFYFLFLIFIVPSYISWPVNEPRESPAS